MILYSCNVASHKVSCDTAWKEVHSGLSLAKGKRLILRDAENLLDQSSPGVSEVETEIPDAL